MFTLSMGEYKFRTHDARSPAQTGNASAARLDVDWQDHLETDTQWSAIEVYRNDQFIIRICGARERSSGCSAMLLVPETSSMFVFMGTRVGVFNLNLANQVFDGNAFVCAWGWERHGDTVFLVEELALTAFDLAGIQRWSVCMDPPHSFRVKGQSVITSECDSWKRIDIASGVLQASGEGEPPDS